MTRASGVEVPDDDWWWGRFGLHPVELLDGEEGRSSTLHYFIQSPPFRISFAPSLILWSKSPLRKLREDFGHLKRAKFVSFLQDIDLHATSSNCGYLRGFSEKTNFRNSRKAPIVITESMCLIFDSMIQSKILNLTCHGSWISFHAGNKAWSGSHPVSDGRFSIICRNSAHFILN